MRDAITNFIHFQPQNLIPEVGYLAVGIWIIMLICAVFSVLSLKLARFATVAWLLAIVALPLVGLFAYCLYCFTKVEFTMLPAFGAWQQQLGSRPALTEQPLRIWPQEDAGAPGRLIAKRDSTNPPISHHE